MSHIDDLENFDSSPPTILAGESEQDLGHQTLDMKCEMRSSKNIFFLGYHQRMPAAQKITDIKQSLGYGSKTHYTTMLKKPTRKLRPFVYPKLTVDELKILVVQLITANAAKRKMLREYALRLTTVKTDSSRKVWNARLKAIDSKSKVKRKCIFATLLFLA